MDRSAGEPVRRTVPRSVLGRTAAAALVAFAALAVAVRGTGELPGDGVLTRLSVGGGARGVAETVDLLTGYVGTALLTALVVLALVRLRRRREAVLCVLSVSGAMVGTALLKRLVARPRPELLPPTADVSQFSFPSGHAAVTVALVVAVVLAARGTRALLAVAVAGALLGLVAAAAQLGLGLHRPSDVVGGWLWAAAWTTAAWAVLDRPAAR